MCGTVFFGAFLPKQANYIFHYLFKRSRLHLLVREVIITQNRLHLENHPNLSRPPPFLWYCDLSFHMGYRMQKMNQLEMKLF